MFIRQWASNTTMEESRLFKVAMVEAYSMTMVNASMEEVRLLEVAIDELDGKSKHGRD